MGLAKNKNYLILTLLFFFIGCSSSTHSYDARVSKFEEVTFDVVEKEYSFDGVFSDNVKTLTSDWVDQKVKVDGFDGKVSIKFFDYKEIITNLDNGKKIEVSMKFNLQIIRNKQTQKKTLNGIIDSFGTLTGTFSLNDFDLLINDTQADLVLRLSKELKKNI